MYGYRISMDKWKSDKPHRIPLAIGPKLLHRALALQRRDAQELQQHQYRPEDVRQQVRIRQAQVQQ